jgi:hypothetical protein
MLHAFEADNDAVRFFSRTPFFTREEFAQHYVADGHRWSSVDEALRYYCATGRIVRVRRGLFASYAVEWDPFVLAAKLAPNPIIAYEGALAFHGLSAVENSMPVAAAGSIAPFAFDEIVYRTTPHPLPRGEEQLYTSTTPRWDVTLRVTSPARTLVDCLDRLHLGPGFVETFEAFAAKPDFAIDFNEAVAYALKLGSRVTAARVGACLWGHPRWNSVSYDQQFTLARCAPRHTMYAVPPPIEDSTYLARFRLIVPGAFMNARHRHE